MCRVRPKSSDRFFDGQDPLELGRGLVLKLLAGVSHQQVDRAAPRSVQPADRLDLRQDHLVLDILERAELANHVGRLLGQNAPDRRVVEVNRKAVARGKLDALARDVNRIVGRRRAQAVAAQIMRGAWPGRAAAGAVPRLRSWASHRQAGLGIANADDVDPFLLGIEEVNAGLKDVLLNASLGAGLGIARLVGHHADVARRDQGRVVGLVLDPSARLGAGVDIHDLDVIRVRVDSIASRRQDLAEDAAITLGVDQIGSLGERLADLGDTAHRSCRGE